MLEESEGCSPANRGQHYVWGHYSRGRYSRADGRSEMMEHLDSAEQGREDIRRFMRKLEDVW